MTHDASRPTWPPSAAEKPPAPPPPHALLTEAPDDQEAAGPPQPAARPHASSPAAQLRAALEDLAFAIGEPVWEASAPVDGTPGRYLKAIVSGTPQDIRVLYTAASSKLLLAWALGALCGPHLRRRGRRTGTSSDVAS